MIEMKSYESRCDIILITGLLAIVFSLYDPYSNVKFLIHIFVYFLSHTTMSKENIVSVRHIKNY